MASLTPNAIEQMLRSTHHDEGTPGRTMNTFHPILQILSVKIIPGQNGQPDRYRLILSDGQHYIQSMAGPTTLQIDNSSAYAVAHISELQPNTIIRMNDFIPKAISKRIVVIVLSFVVVAAPTPARIGQPVDIEKTTGVIDDLLRLAENCVGFGSLHPPSVTSSANPSGQPLYNSTNKAPGVHNNNEMKSNSSTYPTAMVVSPTTSSSSAANPYGRPSQVTSSSNSNAPIVRSMAMANSSHITPISALNMYNNRWTIQGRVTNKSDIRTWSNSKGEGSLFSIEILDNTGTDIRATFFKEAVDKFYSMLQTGSIYTFTGGRLKVANMQYNTCKSNFEITFDQNAEIHLQPDNGTISKQHYDFINKIADIEHIDANSKNIDVVAIVKSVGPVASLISKKSGQELMKCDIQLIDDSGIEISMTLWGTQAERAGQLYSNYPVVAVRRARITEYGGGKSLGASVGGGIDLNPDVPQAQQLRQWFQRSGGINNINNAPGRSLSSAGGPSANRMDPVPDRKDIAAIKDENLGYNDKPDYVTIKGVCTFIKKDKEGGAWYPACANAGEPCRNLYKVTQSTDGQWFCEKCNNYYAQPTRRWIFSAVIEDTTGSTWVSFFNEQAETLLGISADEGYRRAYQQTVDGSFDSDAYESIFVSALHREYLLKCKIKNETNPLDGESRVKTSVAQIQPIDYQQESIELLAALEKL